MKRSMKSIYGAMELKIAYQTHMLLGMFGAVFAATAVVLFIWLTMPLPVKSAGPVYKPVSNPPQMENFDRPPAPPPNITGDVKVTAPLSDRLPGNGRPLVVEAPLDTEDALLTDQLFDPGRFDHSAASDIFAGTDNNGNGVGNGFADVDDFIPPSKNFIKVEQMPEPVYVVEPAYPRLAREGGLDASVTVNVFIDKSGVPKKVEIARCSRPGIGFEDSCKKAALKARYRPAMRSGAPVGVWITYKFVFDID